MTIKDVGTMFELSNPTVIKIFNQNNIERYKKAQVYNPNMDEHYFEIIDTEFKAYYLGMIITDGNVFVPKDGRQSSISITQKEDDEYILKRFLEDVHSNTSVGYDGRGCAQVAVRSDIMAKDLKKYGIEQNKTLNTYLPIINDNLMSHLIRGILDGDGNITAHKIDSGRYLHSLSFCGIHKLMKDIGEYLGEHLKIRIPKIYDYADRNLSEIKWGATKDIFEIGEWIYNNSNICLIRKKNLYEDFKEYYSL